MKKFDIFISYRRVGTGDKAEHLMDLLDMYYKGRISFDKENLTGLFATQLIERIDNCKDFILIIGKESFKFESVDFEPESVELYTYLATCSQREFEAKINELGPNAVLDFVRIEIARALNRKGLNIIPLAPQASSDFKFSDLKLPDDIVGVKAYEALFYSDNVDARFKDVLPKLRFHLKSKPDIPAKKLILSIIALLLIVAAAFAARKIHTSVIQRQISQEISKAEALISEKAMDTEIGQTLYCFDGITMLQIQTVNEILDDMVMVEGGTFLQGAAPNPDGSYDKDVYQELETPQLESRVNTFYISQRELSLADWHGIYGTKYDKTQAASPMVDMSFEECEAFVEYLRNLTGLNFLIPTEAQWEYAARGGVHQDKTKYSGSDNPSDVAVYEENSGGRPSSKPIENSPFNPNSLDIFNMSGNVCEWCSDIFKPYNPDIPALNATDRVIRGGSFESPAYELTVYHRSPMNPADKVKSVGLRLVISK